MATRRPRHFQYRKMLFGKVMPPDVWRMVPADMELSTFTKPSNKDDVSAFAAFDCLPVPVAVVDAQGRIVFCNRKLLAWSGHSREAVLNTDFFDVFLPAEQQEWVRTVFLHCVSQNSLPPQFTSRLISNDASRDPAEHIVEWRLQTILDPSGQVQLVAGIGLDVTSERQDQRELQDTREQLQLALTAAGMRTWSWSLVPEEMTEATDLDSATMLGKLLPAADEASGSFNTAAFARVWQEFLAHNVELALRQSGFIAHPHSSPPFLGDDSLLSSEEASQRAPRFFQQVHPDDRERVERALRTSLNDSTLLDIEFRVIDDKHQVRWIYIKGRVVASDTGLPLRLAGVCMDVTDRNETELALRDSLALHEAIINNAAQGITVYDTELRYVIWNPFMEKLSRLKAEDVLGRRSSEVFPHLRENGILQYQERALLGEVVQVPDYVLRDPATGEEYWIAARFAPLRNPQGDVIGVIGLINNISSRVQTEAELLRSNAILEATQEASADGICLVDRLGSVVRFNRRFAELWRIPEGEARRDDVMIHVLAALEDPDEFIHHINELYDNPQMSARDEVRLRDGRVFDRYSAPAVTPDGRSHGRVWSFSDITDRKASQLRLEYQAFHDPLTDLPNRTLFLERLEQALLRSRRQSTSVAILFLDLDRFKNINDSLGHEAGDQLLIQVAQRLRNALRLEDTAARLGGDEFVILLEGIHAIEEAELVAQRVAETLSAPFTIVGQEIYITASIGININGDGRETPSDMLRDADTAMYCAKQRGRASYQLFETNMNSQALEHLQMETDLRRALARDEFELHYQPIFSLANGHVMGVEALLRWRHPERGLVAPSLFIPLAEETGLIVSIGHWILKQACQTIKDWNSQHPDHNLLVSVNISARQFTQSELVRDVQNVLEETKIDPHCLVLEMTESVLMDDAQSTVTTLNALKTLGIDLAVDDFGTGYSSLAYLKRFPVSHLKIDRTFVNGLDIRSEDTAIVNTIVMLSKTLGLDVVAEGVETFDQRDQLRELGCHRAQGFCLARPMPEAQLIKYLESVTVASP